MQDKIITPEIDLNSRFDDLALELGLAANLALILSSEELHREQGAGRMSSAIYTLANEIDRLTHVVNEMHTLHMESMK